MIMRLLMTNGGAAPCFPVALCGLGLGLLAGSPSLLAASPASPAPAKPVPAEVVYPPSEFSDEIGRGCDPFFPQSTRRQPKAAVASAPARGKAKPVAEMLSLRGILAGNNNRRLALINSRVFSKGETFDISIPNGRMRVRCLEIKPSSVILSVEGGPEHYELHMRQE